MITNKYYLYILYLIHWFYIKYDETIYNLLSLK